MASSPYWKLRRLADRVLRVHARRSGESGAIAAYGPTLLPKTATWIAAYDAARNAEAGWKKEMKEGKGATAALVKLVRAWLPTFARDVAGFTATDFVDRPEVPDDVFGDVGRLLEVAASANATWSASFETEVQPKLAAAETEWREAEAADGGYQRLLRQSREAAGAFDAELQLYRVTLAAALGTRDKDFQRLRADRAGDKDEDDTEPLAGGPGAGQPPTPA